MNSRSEKLASLTESNVWDAVVVGGGITGAGIYRELALRGLKVLLIEQRDFAWGTSSRSSKMVHGGLRYLGKGQFGLARDSVTEREKLMRELPGLVDPLPFMMGHYKGKFPGPWLFGKLLRVYDWMAGRMTRGFVKSGLKDFWIPGITDLNLEGASSFGDAVTDDSRLVMRVLREGDAAEGLSLNYMKALNVDEFDKDVISLTCEDCSDQSDDQRAQAYTLQAKTIINATGAWSDTLRSHLGSSKLIRPLRGSHIILPHWRLPVSFSVSFMHPDDGRPVFVFPWEGASVVGTTDLDHDESLDKEPSITEDELEYLLRAANSQFDQHAIGRQDIISSWSGVRPVVLDQSESNTVESSSGKESKPQNPSDANREHVVLKEGRLISIAGGKLTTFRLIAMEVLEHLKNSFSVLDSVEELEPRAFVPPKLSEHLSHSMSSKHQLFDFPIGHLKRERLAGRYGVDYLELVSLLYDERALSENVSVTDTLWAELVWSCLHESVVHLDDLLLRRTRIGLLLPKGAEEEMQKIKTLCQRFLNWSDARWEQELERYQGIYHSAYSLPSATPQ